MKTKPRVLVLTSSFPRWPGDQTSDYVRQHAVQLADRFDVTVLTSACQGASMQEEGEGVSVVRFHYALPRCIEVLDSATDHWPTLKRSRLARVVLPFYLASFFWQALRLARQADALLSHWLIPSGLIAACIASWLGKPHVVIEHSGALRVLMHLPGGRWMTRMIVRRSRHLITVTEELRQKLIELAPEAEERTSVISMGVNTSRLGPTDHDVSPEESRSQWNGSRVVLYLGRLAEVKGVAHLIEAMDGLEGAVLIVAGNGEYKSKLEHLSGRRNMQVLFLGAVAEDEKRAWLNRCDVVVIPSVVLTNGQTEGLPVVCLEAIAAGKPIIASRVGGLPEVIRDGENGLLVEPANAGALRAALARVLDSQPLRSTLSTQARLTAQQYDWDVVGKKFTRLLERVIHE
ncbi:MAG: glycosyltransferase [Acidobacteria bacterium]|nr:glycosyltransferase [Acidobacteriota bacterium]